MGYPWRIEELRRGEGTFDRYRERRTRPQLGRRPGRRALHGLGHLPRPGRAADAFVRGPGDPDRAAAPDGDDLGQPRRGPPHDRACRHPRRSRRRRVRTHPARAALQRARRRSVRGGAEHQRGLRTGLAALPRGHRRAHRTPGPHRACARPRRPGPRARSRVRRARCDGQRRPGRPGRRRPCAVRAARDTGRRCRGGLRRTRRRDRRAARPQAHTVVPDHRRTGSSIGRRAQPRPAVGHGSGSPRANTPNSGAAWSTCRPGRWRNCPPGCC